ncbi:hypothetical protein HOV23_gp091 [Pseudomonas phage Lana]|uniref:Uncharacterized protein n=1 Tax=Pseudomonas phage Lana TaxID=2530172 RepID=A0A481W7S0_9CAUD|nr:hypothetical protein HOV23_gp091 [Pseudomonas phage Lana]QBJ04482.1 hypothetical protein [Pseudomonas phage Lana]
MMAEQTHKLLNGVRIIATPSMTDSKTEEVPRSWKERLFSLPWQPLKKVRYVTTQVPSDQIIRFQDTFFAHPALIEKIEAAIKNQEAA